MKLINLKTNKFNKSCTFCLKIQTLEDTYSQLQNTVFTLFYYGLMTDFSKRFLLTLNKSDYVMYGFICLMRNQAVDPLAIYTIKKIRFLPFVIPCLYFVITAICYILNHHDRGFKTNIQKTKLTNLLNLSYLKSIFLFRVPLVTFSVFTNARVVGLLNFYQVFYSQAYTNLYNR